MPQAEFVSILRELFRNLRGFRDLYEFEGTDTILGPDGIEWCLWDLLYLYEEGLPKLPPRQRFAIKLFLVDNVKEEDCAILLGTKPTNPTGTYATDGLKNLVRLIENGDLPRFRYEGLRRAG